MSDPNSIILDDGNESTKRRKILHIDDNEKEEECIVGYNIGATELDLRPLGEPIEVFGEGTQKTSNYTSLAYNGLEYHLEDTVLFYPEHEGEKPYVAIIKKISKTCEEPLKVTVQWLYRPEETAKLGSTYQPRCMRELILSFHIDEVHAEAIMHACVVHFVPLSKKIPDREQHPGFVVQYVYDFREFKMYSIADRDYKEDEQREIDRLLTKTIEELGDLPDVVEPEQVENEHLNKEMSVGSEYYSILSSYNLLTNTRTRNTWLRNLLESVQSMCTAMSHNQSGNEEEYELPKWPYEAVSAVAALEEAAHSALSANPRKHKQKMRQLVYNLKNNDVLARRLLKKELEPAQILNMSPEELKAGLIAEEMSTREPEDVRYLQMTEASCINCSEKQVALMNIFQVGSRNRYQMECQACGKPQVE